MRIDDLCNFIEARHRTYLAKAAGKPKPWTKDGILQEFRFCNVYRELDTETRWIADNWRTTWDGHEDLWFAMLVARFTNWHPTMAQITNLVLPFSGTQLAAKLNKIKATGAKVFTGAYTISTNGIARDKIGYVVGSVMQPAWAARKEVRPRKGDTLAAFSERLCTLNGFKGFMAGQVVCDTKYAKKDHLAKASDWDSWAVSGPGSRRGMYRVMGRTDVEGKMSYPEAEWLESLNELRAKVNVKIKRLGFEELHAQDLQNCLCEFDKYERVRLGQGRPRALYTGWE